VASSTGPLTVQFTAAGLSLLQSWISGGANNYGMIITSDTTSDGADFHSSESTSAMSRPKLNVVYSTPPVPVNLPPMAAFGESCTDLDCNFTDASTDTDGSVVSWSWDFGDGNNSSLQNPSHTYLAAGSYSVTLTATDDGGLSDISSHPVMVTAPNVAPTAAFSESCTDLDCNFTDASTDSDGSVVSWSWNFGDGNSSSERNPSHTFAGANTYTVSLTVTDNDGATGFSSKPVTVEEASVPVDNLAAADLVGSGTVTGDFTVTHVDDDLTQMIRERESGGKKNNRHSFLEHSWRFDLVPGATATVLVNAWGSVSSDGDNFVFAWSADNDQFTDLFTVDSIDDDIIQTAMITGPVSGSVYLRVRDTNRTQGNRALDTVFIDSLVVRTESAAGEPPAAPDSVSAVATGPDRIFVDWADKSNDELGFEIQVSENGSSYDPAGSVGPGVTNYLDTGLTGLTTYWYQVRAFNASGNSAWTTAVSATTEAPPDISLSLAGSKQRGQHVVTLTWSGITGGSVDIHRDGPFLLSTSNDGNHVDNTGNKGGRTYTYKVCEAGTEICSALVSITF
jgi:PKD repeat protein